MSLKQSVKPILTLLIRLFGILPIQNKILFSAFSARVYGDNPKYIAEEVKHQKLNAICIFVLDDPKSSKVPSGIKVVKYNSLRYLYELATAKIWVDNTRKQNFVVKRPNQIYIQTWHGSIPFKKIERHVESTLNPVYIRTAKRDSAMIDYLLVNSELAKHVFQDAFWNPKELVITGSPRMDRLIDNGSKLKEKALNNLKLSSEVKYILYAPTFRDSGDTSVYNINFEDIIHTAERRFGGKWRVILKLHPNIRKTIFKSSDNVINASFYADITELYALCSMIITDYSSAMFDFAITGKPVFLYTPDLLEYSKLRPTYLKVNELPFSFAKTLHELDHNVLDFNEKTYNHRVNKFYRKLNVLEDGNASKRVVKIMKKYIN